MDASAPDRGVVPVSITVPKAARYTQMGISQPDFSSDHVNQDIETTFNANEVKPNFEITVPIFSIPLVNLNSSAPDW